MNHADTEHPETEETDEFNPENLTVKARNCLLDMFQARPEIIITSINNYSLK